MTHRLAKRIMEINRIIVGQVANLRPDGIRPGAIAKRPQDCILPHMSIRV
jgi:hypothetical protein